MERPVLFALGGNDVLAGRIAKHLKAPLSPIIVRSFSDGEQYVQLGENVRGRDVFIIQSTQPPAENWIRLLLAIDAARGASAREITAVVPYYGYARQDRKARPREPIATRVFATALDALRLDRLLTVDLHTDAITGMFRHANVDYLYARPVFVHAFEKRFRKEIARDSLVVVSPDAGGVIRAQSYAKRLMKNADLAIIHKEREIPNKVARMKLIGDVAGKTALIVDDMADTCGTLARAAALLTEHGASAVYAAATHAVLSANAQETIANSSIQTLFITDTIPHAQLGPKIEVVSLAPLLGEAIRRLGARGSLSALFE